jgi:hypothetical protein
MKKLGPICWNLLSILSAEKEVGMQLLQRRKAVTIQNPALSQAMDASFSASRALVSGGVLLGGGFEVRTHIRQQFTEDNCQN